MNTFLSYSSARISFFFLLPFQLYSYEWRQKPTGNSLHWLRLDACTGRIYVGNRRSVLFSALSLQLYQISSLLQPPLTHTCQNSACLTNESRSPEGWHHVFCCKEDSSYFWTLSFTPRRQQVVAKISYLVWETRDYLPRKVRQNRKIPMNPLRNAISWLVYSNKLLQLRKAFRVSVCFYLFCSCSFSQPLYSCRHLQLLVFCIICLSHSILFEGEPIQVGGGQSAHLFPHILPIHILWLGPHVLCEIHDSQILFIF